MNKISRKLILTAVATLFAVVALGSSTFAWFTLTQKASVSPYTLDISSGVGVKIGVSTPGLTEAQIDAHLAGTQSLPVGAFFSGYGESVTMNDIERSIGETVIDGVIDKVELVTIAGAISTTSSLGITNEALDIHRRSNYYSIRHRDATANAEYLNFKIWLKVETIENSVAGTPLLFNILPEYNVKAVTVNPFKLAYSAELAAELPTGNAAWAKDATVSVSAANALRIATVHTEARENDNSVLTEYNDVRVFAPADSTDNGSGAPQYADLGGSISRDLSRGLTYYHNVNTGLSSYNGATSGSGWGTNGIRIPDGTFEPNIARFITQTTHQSAATLASYVKPVAYGLELENLTTGVIGSSVLGIEYSIFLDGWDADCFDAIYLQQMIINMKFNVAKQ